MKMALVRMTGVIPTVQNVSRNDATCANYKLKLSNVTYLDSNVTTFTTFQLTLIKKCIILSSAKPRISPKIIQRYNFPSVISHSVSTVSIGNENEVSQ